VVTRLLNRALAGGFETWRLAVECSARNRLAQALARWRSGARAAHLDRLSDAHSTLLDDQRAALKRALRALLGWRTAAVCALRVLHVLRALGARVSVHAGAGARGARGGSEVWAAWVGLWRRRRSLRRAVHLVSRVRAQCLQNRAWGSWVAVLVGVHQLLQQALAPQGAPQTPTAGLALQQLSPSFKARPPSPRAGGANSARTAAAKIERVVRYSYSKPLDQWLTSEVQVMFGAKPFAQGSSRACFMVWEVDGRGSVGDTVLVAKLPLAALPSAAPLHTHSLHTHSTSRTAPASAASAPAARTHAHSNGHSRPPSTPSAAAPSAKSIQPLSKSKPAVSAAPAAKPLTKTQRLAEKASELSPYFAVCACFAAASLRPPVFESVHACTQRTCMHG
jgi:hypothetical protein